MIVQSGWIELNIDYSFERLSHNDKQYMVVKDIKEEHILQYQLHMLLNNDLSNVCTMEMVESKNLHTLYFDRTSLQSLESYYKGKTITKKQYVNLLLDVIDILLRGEQYLLPHHQYVLEPKYIFIDEETQKPYLIFMPIKGERAVNDSLCELVNFLNQLPKTDDLLDLSFRIEEQLGKSTTIKRLKFLLQGKHIKQQQVVSAVEKQEEEVAIDDRKNWIAMIIVLSQVLLICILIFLMNIGLLRGLDITKIMSIMVIFSAIDILIYQRYKKQLENETCHKAVPEEAEGLVIYKEKGEYYICFRDSGSIHR